jgi:RHS repeat-associated protein
VHSRYVWDSGSPGRSLGRGRYIDSPVLRDEDLDSDGDCTDDEGTGSERLCYANDANFNVTALVETDGAVAERTIYDAYGQPTLYDATWSATIAESASKANEIRFCGYVYDAVVGLYTVRYRVYDPALGRWVQRDPAGYVDGLVLYQYVSGLPVDSLDPLGLLDFNTCTFQQLQFRLKGKTGFAGKFDASWAVRFLGRREICRGCCPNRTSGMRVKGKLQIRGQLEIGVASWTYHKEWNTWAFRANIDIWAGLRAYGGIRLEGNAEFAYDSCSDEFSADAYIALSGYVGLQGGFDFRARVTAKKWYLRWMNGSHRLGANVDARLTLKWRPKLRCNRTTCSIEGPLKTSLRGAVNVHFWRLSYTGAVETSWDTGKFGVTFDNPLAALLE